jgi:DNA replication and repair protein RecF
LIATLTFDRLSVRDFRNIVKIDLAPTPRFNVIAGDNGQGKTSIIEALYLIATTRSFRTEKLRETVRDEQESASLGATVAEGGLERAHRIVVTPSGASVQLDGKRPARLASYATKTPVVVFHPGDLELVNGPSSCRRRLLDRVGLFVDPASGDHRQRYEKAKRARQAVLEARGTSAIELDPFEQLMVEHGAALGRARRLTAERLGEALVPAFDRMLAAPVELGIRFVPGGAEDTEDFRSELRRRRVDDRRRGSATFGPHRDELALTLDGRSARHHGSQGQQRILTLALKSAELDCVREARRAHPVLLLDDVSSELDPTRTGAVYDFLRGTRSQVFVTTTRPELFETPGIGRDERVDWCVRDGVLVG